MTNPLLLGESADLFDSVTGEHVGFLNRAGDEQKSVVVREALGEAPQLLVHGVGVVALAEVAEVATLTATGTALTGAGEYRGFHVRAISGTPQTVTVYDNTSATGTPIHTASVSATGFYPWALGAARPLGVGCRVVISGGTSRTIDVLVA